MEINGNNNNLTNDMADNVVVDDDSKVEESSVGEHHHSSHSHHHGGHHSHSHHSEHRGHGHHSGRRRHRRRHHSSSKKKKAGLNVKFGKKTIILFCVLLAIFAIVVTAYEFRQYDFLEHTSADELSDILTVEVINQEGVLVKDAIKKYLLIDLLNPENASITPTSLSMGEGRLDAQVPVAIKLSTKEGSARAYKIEIADNDTFLNSTVSYYEAASGIYEFEHLYTNTTYYYRVTVYTGSGVDSVTGYFKTADTPRILSVDGLSKVRDIGNWKTDSGKRIKQGLLLRGTEMDGAVESGYHLTNDGLADMLEVFGIKTDIDLRADTITSKDALGSRVDHIYYDMVMYDGAFTEAGKEKIRMVFADLANPDIYPVYLHCTYGCDRTGTVCYILEALLGVSRGDCLKEYGLSNMNIANIKIVENGLKNYEGNTLKEQAESYLLSCGVTEYQIESIRKIFLGE